MSLSMMVSVVTKARSINPLSKTFVRIYLFFHFVVVQQMFLVLQSIEIKNREVVHKVLPRFNHKVKVAGKKAMIIPFATLGILAAIMALLFLPETKGLALQETIEEAEGTSGQHELQPLHSDVKDGEHVKNK
uniref:Uncharacterized protein n=1 Tax=Ditylenchus dipsaci TaxID=166011 RepID=A0A915EM42_9BILA